MEMSAELSCATGVYLQGAQDVAQKSIAHYAAHECMKSVFTLLLSYRLVLSLS